MSVLNLPRLHFGGQALWNPNTANNSPGVYDESTLEPNPDIAPDDFVKWLTTLTQNPPIGQSGLNGSWNVYGDGSCWFRDVRVSGVQFDYGQTPVTDPIVTMPGRFLQIVGGTFDDAPPDAAAGPPPRSRMVDVAPYQSTTTQLFYRWLQLGDEKLGFRAKGACRMYLRWSMLRNTDTAGLQIAGPAGVIFQTSAAASDIEWWNASDSPALTALQTAANASPNQGITVQFAVYLTLYYQNASYQGVQLSDAATLSQAYANGFTGGNPAQSVITGTLGVWGPDELASAPTQILLAPANPVTRAATPMPKPRAMQEGTMAAPPAAPTPFPLGPAMATVDSYTNNLAVSFVSTILESDEALTKEPLGTLTLQLAGAPAWSSKIADIPYKDYDKAAYRRTSGILDFTIAPEQVAQIQNGTAQLQLIVAQTSGPVVALQQQTSPVVETDQRGEYLDEGEWKTMSVSVYQNGVPASNIQLTVAQYAEDPVQLDYVPVTNFADALVDLGAEQYQITIDVENGVAEFPIRYVKPGTAMLGFFPAGVPVETDVNFPGTTSSYAVIRLLGADNALLDLPDDQITWPNTYADVLQCYDLVYPKMSTIIDLGSETAVSDAAKRILAVTAYPQRFDWTLFMPVTREMSKGKRSLLRRFCVKVIEGEIPSSSS